MRSITSLFNKKRERSTRPGSLQDKERSDPNKRIKQSIWLYFFLLIFEGALRKWVFPEFSSVLLIIRDPVAILIMILCVHKGIFKINTYVAATWAIAFLSLSLTLTLGHRNLPVALYGLRIFLIQFPIIFVIGRVFDRDDVMKMGRVLLWISIPMTILMIVQFYSSQSDWVNRGLAGSAEGAGYRGAMGYFRPPGTFSFISGLAQFYGLVAAFVFYFWLEGAGYCNRWLLLVVSGCVLMSIPFSISRTVFYSIAISLCFAAAAAARKPRYLSRLIAATAAAALLSIVLVNFEFVQTGVEAFTDRFEFATESEGGAQGTFADRFLGGMVGAVLASNSIPTWGYGLGMGTNAGAMMLSGNIDFLISEGEWGRLIGEMGLLLGLGAILVRVFLGIELLLRSIRAIGKKNCLPWMLLSFGFLTILQGQWAQPTSLGFAILTAGLVLAAFKVLKRPLIPTRAAF